MRIETPIYPLKVDWVRTSGMPFVSYCRVIAPYVKIGKRDSGIFSFTAPRSENNRCRHYRFCTPPQHPQCGLLGVLPALPPLPPPPPFFIKLAKYSSSLSTGRSPFPEEGGGTSGVPGVPTLTSLSSLLGGLGVTVLDPVVLIGEEAASTPPPAAEEPNCCCCACGLRRKDSIAASAVTAL